MHASLWMLAGAMLLAGCEAAPPEPAANGSDFDSSSGPAAMTRPAAPAATAIANPGAPAPAAEHYALAVTGEGLRLINREQGSAQPLAFGMARDQAMRTVGNVLGAPVAQGESPDCPAGPATSADFSSGLSLVFRDDRFVGWDLGAGAGSAGPITTMTGAGVGDPRSALEQGMVVEVEQSSLGTEFRTGGISGLLSSDAPDATIESMWAGAVCIYR